MGPAIRPFRKAESFDENFEARGKFQASEQTGILFVRDEIGCSLNKILVTVQ
jgi:hypothetical protein